MWLRPGQDALSLGEGEGRNALWLASQGLKVTAVDLSSVAMNRLAEQAASAGLPVTAVQADLSQWPIAAASWDLIVSVWCHLPSPLRRVVHRGVVEGLRPNGTFLLEAYTPDQVSRGTGGPSNPDLLPTPELLEQELHGLTIVSLRAFSRDINEGALHRGVGDVVQLVARKSPR